MTETKTFKGLEKQVQIKVIIFPDAILNDTSVIYTFCYLNKIGNTMITEKQCGRSYSLKNSKILF